MGKKALGVLLSVCMLCCLLSTTVLGAALTCTVTFDANGGSGSMDCQIVVAEEETALTANEYTRAGYWFAGWSTTADGTGATYADGASVALGTSLTLYAQWEQYPAQWAFGSEESAPTEEDYAYGTLEAAFAAANGNTAATLTYVKLNTDVTTTGQFTLAAGKSMVLDLNEKTIEVTATDGTVYGICTGNNSCLTLNNGTLAVEQTGNSNAYGIYGYADLILNNCIVTVDSAGAWAYGIMSRGLIQVTESTIAVTGANKTYGVCAYDEDTTVSGGRIAAESDNYAAYGVYSKGDVVVSGATICAQTQSNYSSRGAYGIYASGNIILSGAAQISGKMADIYVNEDGQLWGNDRAANPIYYTGAVLKLGFDGDAKHDAVAVCGVNEENKDLFALIPALAENYSLVFDNDVLTLYGRVLDLEWYDSDAVTLLTGSDYPSTIHYGQAFAQMPALEKTGFVFEGWYYCTAGNDSWSSVIWDKASPAQESMKLRASFGSAIGSGEDGARIYQAGNGDVFLGGDYIELGLRPSGVFGTAAEAPTDGDVAFHPTHNQRIGLRSNGNLKWSAGFATGPNETVDFFLPGTIDEGWMVGWTTVEGEKAAAKGGAQSYGSGYGEYGVDSGDSVDAWVNSVEGVDTLNARTTASINELAVVQQISFDVTAKYFTTTVTLTNNGDDILYDLSYIRAFDPDQRATLTKSHTDNYFYKDTDGNVWVIAFGNDSLNVGNVRTTVDYDTMVTNNRNAITPFVFCAKTPAAGSGYTVEAVNTKVGWSSVDYNSFYRGSGNYSVGNDLYGNHYYADSGIGLEFVTASLEPGQSVTFSWISSLDTSIGSTVENIQKAISAKGGTLDSPTGSVQLELNAAVDGAGKFVVKKDDTVLVQGTDYVITNADTITPTIQFKMSAGLNCISVITVEIEGVASPVAITNRIPHTWGFELSNQNTIAVGCLVAGCTADGGSISITAPAGELIYDGTAKEALVGVDSLADGVAVPAIVYAGNLTGEKPVNAGDYTASITLGECTAYVNYTIAKARASAVSTPAAMSTIPYGSPLSATALSDSAWTWVDATLIPTGSGEYNAYRTVTDDTNYDYSEIAGYDPQMHAIIRGIPVQVNKATLAITARNKAVPVGQPVPVLTESDYTVSGLINGDTLAEVGLTVSLSYAEEPDMSQPGFTEIIVHGVGAQERYSVEYINGVLAVGSAPAIATTSLPDGTVGTTYSQTLAISGDEPISWSIINGALPDGLILVDGTICGTPTATGDFTFVVQATNGLGSDTKELVISVGAAPPPVITTASLPNGTVGSAYSQTLVTSGDGPITWSVEQGNLPDGLTLAGDVICGVPTAAGTYTFVIQVSNAGGSSTKELSITVNDVYVVPSYLVVVEQADGGTVETNGKWFCYGETVVVSVKEEYHCVLIGLTVTDDNGKDIRVTDKGDGKYTFQMPACKVTVRATFHRCPSLDYPDVDTSRWYHECIDYVLDHNLMDGIADGVFAPDGIASRAMMVVAIWRSEGSCIVDYKMDYTDLKEDSPYAEAVRWATSVGIVEGFPDGSFRGDEAITREQMAAVFYRYEKFRGEGYSGEWYYVLPYADADAVGAWAYEAVCWNTHVGVVQGDGVNFDPKGMTTRAHVAQLLMNYLEQ